MTRTAQRWTHALHRAIEAVACALLLLLSADVLLGVADRFLLKIGWPWPEELARYLLVWLSFLAAAVAARTQSHFVIDFFVVRCFTGRSASIHRAVVTVAVSAVLVLVIVTGCQLTSIAMGQTSPALGLPMAAVYAAIPVGSALMLLFVVVAALPARPTP